MLSKEFWSKIENALSLKYHKFTSVNYITCRKPRVYISIKFTLLFFCLFKYELSSNLLNSAHFIWELNSEISTQNSHPNRDGFNSIHLHFLNFFFFLILLTYLCEIFHFSKNRQIACVYCSSGLLNTYHLGAKECYLLSFKEFFAYWNHATSWSFLLYVSML